jgi:glycosyltransferase involved in cell wall biosynthesis
MLKIAMITEHDQLRGVTRTPTFVALAGALADIGQEVTVLARRVGSEPVQELDARGFRVRWYRDDLTAVLRSCRPDIVHAHSVISAPAAGAHTLDVPFVLTPHASISTRESDLLRSADHVLATYSAQVPRLLVAGVLRKNISVVPYGVDIDHFTPEGSHADKRLAQRVVAFGDMARPSGFGTAVAALPAIPDAELMLVGGPRRGHHADELRDYAHSLGVADRVRPMGPVPRTSLPALLRSADLMVCSPWEATFGVGALEAMASGIAVVANGMGGLADTVVHEVTGTQVAPRKPRELATALHWLLAHPAIREQRGAAGRDRAAARYSWHRIAVETMHAYRRAGATDPAMLAREAAEAARKRGTRQPLVLRHPRLTSGR